MRLSSRRRRSEGHVVWYTTLIVNQAVRPLAKAFEQKYPGIEVQYSRADSGPTALKILNEARAARLQADVFDGNGTVPPLVRAGLVAACLPPTAASYPPRAQGPERPLDLHQPLFPHARDQHQPDPAGRRAAHVAGFAQSQMARPHRLEQQPDRGRRHLRRHRAAADGRGGGLAYLRALAKQQIVSVDATSRAVLDQVITGEYAIALDIFNHHAVLSAAKGAPVDWLKLEPVAAPIQVASLLKDAPHPNAGKLLLEFLTSEEGQRIFAGVDYIPAMPGIAAKVPVAQARCRRLCRRHSPSRGPGAKHGSMDDIVKELFQ